MPRHSRRISEDFSPTRPVTGLCRVSSGSQGNDTIRRKGCHGKGIVVAFLQNFGGSKVKRDKGGMPDEPGNRQKRRQAKAFRRLKRCYDFRKVLRTVSRSEGKERHRNSFSGIRKVLPEEKRPDSGFPNFLRTNEVGSKIKREKGPASRRRPWVRCRAMPAPRFGDVSEDNPGCQNIFRKFG